MTSGMNDAPESHARLARRWTQNQSWVAKIVLLVAAVLFWSYLVVSVALPFLLSIFWPHCKTK